MSNISRLDAWRTCTMDEKEKLALEKERNRNLKITVRALTDYLKHANVVAEFYALQKKKRIKRV